MNKERITEIRTELRDVKAKMTAGHMTVDQAMRIVLAVLIELTKDDEPNPQREQQDVGSVSP